MCVECSVSITAELMLLSVYIHLFKKSCQDAALNYSISWEVSMW